MAHLGTLIVKANVDGAELWLNGERLGQLPMSRVRAPSGTIHIEVRAKDHEPALRNLDLEPGTTITTEIVLQRVPEAASPIVVQSALPSDTPSAPAPATNVKRTLAWGALGGSVLMLGGALTAQAIHDQAANTWNDDSLCTAPGQWRDDKCGGYQSTAEKAQIIANLGYIGASALGVASAILFLVDARARPSARAGVRWSLAATGSSATLIGAGNW